MSMNLCSTRLFFLQARYLVRGILPQEFGLSETSKGVKIRMNRKQKKRWKMGSLLAQLPHFLSRS